MTNLSIRMSGIEDGNRHPNTSDTLSTEDLESIHDDDNVKRLVCSLFLASSLFVAGTVFATGSVFVIATIRANLVIITLLTLSTILLSVVRFDVIYGIAGR